MYICTPFNKIIALNPQTGKEKWRYDPCIKINVGNQQWKRCRGIGYPDLSTLPAPVEQQKLPITASCRKRIVGTTIDARIFTVGTDTGKICGNFGDRGIVDLLKGLGPRATADFYSTSAPLVADGVIMVGGKLNDNLSAGELSGVVRDYDVVKGKLLWAWDPSRSSSDSTPLADGQIYAIEIPNFWGCPCSGSGLLLYRQPDT